MILTQAIFSGIQLYFKAIQIIQTLNTIVSTLQALKFSPILNCLVQQIFPFNSLVQNGIVTMAVKQDKFLQYINSITLFCYLDVQLQTFYKQTCEIPVLFHSISILY